MSPESRYAHQVAPAPVGEEYFDGDKPIADLPGQLARYHAARAYGYYAGVESGTYDTAEGIIRYLYEFELASTWWQLDPAASDGVAENVKYRDVETLAPEIAADVVTDLASPHVIGPNIVTILKHYQINPATIRPYGSCLPEPDAPVVGSAPVKLRDDREATA